jgi:hypothetical protein
MAGLPTLLAQIDLPGLGGEGPGDVESLLTIFYVLLGLGFFVAVMGHLFQVRALVVAGIVLVFLGTAVFFVAVASYG